MSDTQTQDLLDRVKALEASMTQNNGAIERIEANTAEIVDFTSSIKSAMKVLNWIGALAKPLGYIVSAGLAIWGLILAVKGGGIHPK